MKYGALPERPTETLQFGSGGEDDVSWYAFDRGALMDTYTYDVKQLTVSMWINGPGQQELYDGLTPADCRRLADALNRWADAVEADQRTAGLVP